MSTYFTFTCFSAPVIHHAEANRSQRFLSCFYNKNYIGDLIFIGHYVHFSEVLVKSVKLFQENV